MNPVKSILSRLLPAKVSPDIERRAATLLGIDPKRPLREGQIVPQELVARMHQLHLLLGSNASLGYEIDEYRRSWQKYFEYFDWALGRVSEHELERRRRTEP